MRSFILAVLSSLALQAQQRELILTPKEGSPGTVHLHNAYTAPATVWVFGCEREADGKLVALWHRTNQNLTLEPKLLEPGGQGIDVRVPSVPSRLTQKSGSVQCDSFRVTAALFADGTVTGDYRLISGILSEQKSVAQDIEKASEILKKEGIDTASAIQQFEDWQKSLPRMGMPPQPSPGSAVTFGSSTMNLPSSTATKKTGGSPAFASPILTKLVPNAALWLLKKKEKNPADALEILTAWKERLTPFEGVTAAPFREFPKGVTTSQMPVSSQPFSKMAGKPAPDFTLKDADGREFSLKSLRGKPVFLNFWAIWCVPCREEMPQIQALHDAFQAKGLVVAAINYSEPADAVKPYFAKEKLTFHNLLDPDRTVDRKYGGNSIPKVVLIDKDGIVRYVQEGWNSTQDFQAEVRKLGL